MLASDYDVVKFEGPGARKGLLGGARVERRTGGSGLLATPAQSERESDPLW